jgi:hypothetical protein
VGLLGDVVVVGIQFVVVGVYHAGSGSFFLLLLPSPSPSLSPFFLPFVLCPGLCVTTNRPRQVEG